MKLSGNNARAFLETKEASFLLDNFSISGINGAAEFGFSGDSKTISFYFDQGRLYDPEGRYAYSYQENVPLKIKSDIESTSYNYSINDKLISNNGIKEEFKLEKFFINTTGCQVDTSLSIFAERPTHTSSLNGSFLINNNLLGSITNTATGSGVLTIFTGSVVGLNNRYFSFSTLPEKIIPNSTENFILDHKNGPSKTYNLSLLLETNVGLINITGVSDGIGDELLSISNSLDPVGSSTWDTSLPLGDNDGNFGLSFENYGCSGLSGFTNPGQTSEKFNYSFYATSGTAVIESSDVKASLEYVSGNIGKYWMLSGLHLTNEGSGYSGAPYIYFPTIQGNDKESSVQAVTSTDSDGAYYVTGTQLTGSLTNLYGSGVYYNNSISDKIEDVYFGETLVQAIKASEISFSGTKHPDSSELVNASGSGILRGYQKHFSGIFDLSTGIGGDYRSFNVDLLTGVSGDAVYEYDNLLDFCGSTLPYEPGVYENTEDGPLTLSTNSVLNIKVDYYNRFFDSDEIVAKLKISGLHDTYDDSVHKIMYITGKKTS